MAATVAYVITLGTLVLAASVSAATKVVITVVPAGAQACVWNASRPGERRCSVPEGGRFVTDAEDANPAAMFIEFSAPSHFSRVLALREATGHEVRLDPYPHLQWNGWTRDTETKLEWLSTDKGAAWRDLGPIHADDERELAGETRAVRLSSPKASPRTYFFTTPRTSLRIPRSEPPVDGGEIALCFDRPNVIVRVRDIRGKAIEAKTPAHGCVSFAGLAPGPYDVLGDGDAFEPVRTRVDSGRSSWLGTIQLRQLGRVRVRIEDSNSSRRYSVELTQSFPAAAGRQPAAKIIAGGNEGDWEVRPGNYEVTAHPDAFPEIEFGAHAIVDGGGETTVVLRTSYVTVRGAATRRRASAPDVALEFVLDNHDDRARTTVHARTGKDGLYEAVLPSPGHWRVVADTPAQQMWKPHEIAREIPLVEQYEWNLELPGGELTGRVLDKGSGEPIADVSIEVRWQIEGEPAGLVTITSDEGGRFHAAALPETTVMVRANEAMARMLGYIPDVPQSVDLTANAPEVLVSLQHSRTGVRISVLNADGQPEPTAQLFLATADPVTRLLARADGNGDIDVPDDRPLPLIAYVVAAGHPWQRVVVNESHQEPVRVILASPPAPTQIAFTGAAGQLQDDMWGLIDADGLQVPLFYHLLRQGVLPVLRGPVATIPSSGSGVYRLWLLRGGVTRVLGTVVLPSSSVLVVNVE